MMKSCSSYQSSLFLLFTTMIIVAESAVPSVKVKLHDNATLPCSESCSGVVRWTVYHKPDDVLAECSQTTCRSLKEGYHMSHDQYLRRDLSLNIVKADFNKRALYTCVCDSKDLCDVSLQIEPLHTPVQIKTNESLMLKLDISEAVEVIYNGTDETGPSKGQICTIEGRTLQCKPNYRDRALLTSALELREMAISDSGVYTVMDTHNKEIIHIYSVTVKDDRCAVCPTDSLVAVSVLALFVVIFFVFMVILFVFVVLGRVEISKLKRKNQELQMNLMKHEPDKNPNSLNGHGISVDEENLPLSSSRNEVQV
ncbi:uncharacterized protein [Hoplias malabaricus]|uniref:uncharacterized protein isoform X2 n=1 Tax=Hoplias malabaricus TaxID=27720 RepID=UPI003462A2BD